MEIHAKMSSGEIWRLEPDESGFYTLKKMQFTEFPENEFVVKIAPLGDRLEESRGADFLNTLMKLSVKDIAEALEVGPIPEVLSKRAFEKAKRRQAGESVSPQPLVSLASAEEAIYKKLWSSSRDHAKGVTIYEFGEPYSPIQRLTVSTAEELGNEALTFEKGRELVVAHKKHVSFRYDQFDTIMVQGFLCRIETGFNWGTSPCEMKLLRESGANGHGSNFSRTPLTSLIEYDSFEITGNGQLVKSGNGHAQFAEPAGRKPNAITG